MAKIYDLVAVVGKYTKDGQEKAQYMNCGFVNKNDEGKISVKINGLPVGNLEWNGWLSCFEPKPRNASGTPQQPASNSNNNFDDQIPF